MASDLSSADSTCPFHLDISYLIIVKSDDDVNQAADPTEAAGQPTFRTQAVEAALACKQKLITVADSKQWRPRLRKPPT
ncbi:hypothetical protein EMIT0P4_40196 [Pseudomonas sp. IT-P4]